MYSVLFEPAKLGQLTLKNRLIMTAMSTGFANPRGIVTERMLEYYATRAAGGVALVTVEEAYIHPLLPHIRNALGIYSDNLIPGLTALATRIHKEGSLASIQLGIYFRQTLNGFPRFAASAQAPDCINPCLELTKEEIKYIVELFVSAACRAKSAGFDAIEIHACHGCLISEFLSPYWNKRADEYGGSRNGRFRFALEILQRIRETLGADYPVIYRISGSEFHPEGFTEEDAIALSQELEKNGVTAINISGGLGHINHISIPPSDIPRGLLVPIAATVKSHVKVPVIVGNSMTPELASKVIREGKADFIGLGRPLIADPDLPNKLAENRVAEIRRCIRCNQGCFGALRQPERNGISCLYNPEAGREYEKPIKQAPKKKRVVVIGGGPAGCEAARVASLRGHKVTLLEKEELLGGQFNLASAAPGKKEFAMLVEFYSRELERLGVEIRLGTEATAEVLRELQGDVYIVATGSIPVLPCIPGVDLPHVSTAHDVLSGAVEVREDPVVVIGGGAVGLETADFLADRKLEISVVEMLDAVGRDLIPGTGVRESLLARLEKKGVRILTGCRAMVIEADSVVVSDRPLIGGGKEMRVPARRVVIAAGARPALCVPPDTSKKCECYYVGDCACPGNAMNAIHHAFDVARLI
ncbi:FAD-dependent oxidoreductase [Thermodesulforhabdus norvegica]|uniref:2,4-dienoyl-CoA reductase n=1 Tax=Thermodesulforhabdus norvegica TaxID=39841 RepID=A0A1I4R4T8_9BACT|nr:FAD-dependent oxidoreductase [Thermodesulforhabdus norvegica]SFM46933.1 2,4-dienoyl-CoA reductase [Thermodesulforhabdus norvegica]